jgi:hypothetical protein
MTNAVLCNPADRGFTRNTPGGIYPSDWRISPNAVFGSKAFIYIFPYVIK